MQSFLFYFNCTPSSFVSNRSNIQTRQYESVAEVISDILLIYDNCELYNDTASLLGEETARQRNAVKRYCKKFDFE